MVPGRTATGKFQKGKSGNPGGRQKLVGHVRELAQTYTEEAIKTLAAIMQDKKANATSRAAAATALLDRGWGRPSQPIGGADDLPPIDAVTRIERIIVDPAHPDG